MEPEGAKMIRYQILDQTSSINDITGLSIYQFRNEFDTSTYRTWYNLVLAIQSAINELKPCIKLFLKIQ